MQNCYLPVVAYVVRMGLKICQILGAVHQKTFARGTIVWTNKKVVMISTSIFEKTFFIIYLLTKLLQNVKIINEIGY